MAQPGCSTICKWQDAWESKGYKMKRLAMKGACCQANSISPIVLECVATKVMERNSCLKLHTMSWFSSG